MASMRAARSRCSWSAADTDYARVHHVPVEIATKLLASRGNGPASAPVFEPVRRPGSPLSDRAIHREGGGGRLSQCIGSVTRMPATPSTTARRSRWCRRPCAMRI